MTALIIPDGAADPRGGGPTALERASTPALDALCRRGWVRRWWPTPPNVAVGSEAGIPRLMHRYLPVCTWSRGLMEAAARSIDVPAGHEAWRCDLPRGEETDVARAVAGLAARLPGHAVHHLRGHRFLAVGAGQPDAPPGVRVWGGEGQALPRVLDERTVMVAAPGAASGCARMMGAAVVMPPGATGDVDTDMAAKGRAAVEALEWAERVVVHVGAPDEASHDRDPAAKVEAIEALDELVVAPLAEAIRRRKGRLAVCPDHVTDPVSGRHGRGPVPRVDAGSGIAVLGPDRLTERVLRPVHA